MLGDQNSPSGKPTGASSPPRHRMFGCGEASKSVQKVAATGATLLSASSTRPHGALKESGDNCWEISASADRLWAAGGAGPAGLLYPTKPDGIAPGGQLWPDFTDHSAALRQEPVLIHDNDDHGPWSALGRHGFDYGLAPGFGLGPLELRAVEVPDLFPGPTGFVADVELGVNTLTAPQPLGTRCFPGDFLSALLPPGTGLSPADEGFQAPYLVPLLLVGQVLV